MRVAQLLPELNEGGVERGVVDLNAALSGNGVESFIISKGGKLASKISADGGTHIALDIASKNPFSAPYRAFKLRQTLLKIAPDIVHIRSRVPAWLYLLTGLKIPTVSTIHGFNSPNFYSRIMVRADKIVVSCEAVRKYAIKHFSANAANIVKIARGIDLEVFNPQNLNSDFMREFKSRFGIKDGDFIAVSVGRITELKDCETIIKATAILKPQMAIKMLLVGGVHPHKTAYFERLKKLIYDLGVQDSVIFTGSQSNIAEIYALSNIAISASKKPETFGRSVAEAIATNTPAIATDHGGVKDIIKKGENGLFFTPGDAEDLAHAISVATKFTPFDGFSYIKNSFSKELFIKRKIALYKELLDA